MDFGMQSAVGFSDALDAQAGCGLGMVRSSLYTLECRGEDGEIKWAESVHNIVNTVGLNDSLDKQFKASAYTAAWYVGLTNTTPTFAAADTMASHSGWTEFASYSGSNRPTLTLGSVASGSVDNSAAKAVFTMNASGTVGGAFLATSQAVNATTGILYGEAALSSNRSVIGGDTLTITITLTAS
jgi:hypothetical protein